MIIIHSTNNKVFVSIPFIKGNENHFLTKGSSFNFEVRNFKCGFKFQEINEVSRKRGGYIILLLAPLFPLPLGFNSLVVLMLYLSRFH